MPTAFSSSTDRLRACFRVTSSCRRIASASWSPILCTGFRLVIGSWKIIAISFPRISRSRLGFVVRRSSPFHSAVPDEIAVRLGLRPMIVRQVTLLPDPDSPTMPRVWPLSTENETPSTARTTPSSVLKYVFRSLTSRSAIASAESDSWVDHRVREIDEQVDRDDDDGREHDDALRGRQVEAVDRRDRRLAEPREPVDRLREDRAAEGDADVHAEHRDHGQERVA